MLSVEEAQGLVLAEATPFAPEQIALEGALGRVLREEITAAADAPAADNSAMDGYAVRAEDISNASKDTPIRLRVIGDIPAGTVASGSVEPGTAMRIMTGALVPAGADAVVQVELTDGGTGEVVVFGSVKSGASVRRRGEDMRSGDIVLTSGSRIGPAEMAMLAANRRAEVRCGSRPAVAILSTGDELIELDGPPARGKIVNTNSWLLASLVREAGAIARPLGIVADTRIATMEALTRAAESDVVITTGGVSVGAFDFVKEALEALGAETKFWRVAMKPGKPVVLSRLRDRICFGLPGNPVSAFVSFHLFVAPAIRKMLGQREPFLPPVMNVRILSTLKGAPDRRVYFRARAFVREGEMVAEPLLTQGSGSLTSMIGANALIVIEPGMPAEAESMQPAVLLAG